MYSRYSVIFLFFFSLIFFQAKASHIVGGEMTYRYLGDSTSGLLEFHLYSVSLSIYEDCLNGQREAIAEDNPAYLAVFDASTHNMIQLDTSIFYKSSVSVPANFSNSCVANIPQLCLLKKTFVKNYALPLNSSGYVVAYQRCCRNNAIINIMSPGDNGSTYYCTLPSGSITNNSAIFKNYPPQIICLNNPLFYDNSAIDADGDSLSYGFCPALLGASDADVKPIPSPPPYQTAAYNFSYSADTPIVGSPAIQIDPISGLITGTPNMIGRYLVTVYCNEYRNGVLINTIKREFQFVVTDCTKTVIADMPQFSTDLNTYIIDCLNYTVHFVNTSSGGFSWLWNFDANDGVNDTSDAFEPTYTYADTGTFSVKLVANPGSTCPDSITRLVKIYPRFHADFSDSGIQCPGATISFIDLSSATIKPITWWKWDFGDGDTTFTENPEHTYNNAGTFNVTLISENIKNCVDTAVKQLIIDNFHPFAGNDTVVVKGQTVQFYATGGVNYTWSPSSNLDNVNVYNPVGYFPDTGQYTYYVHVSSEYGCAANDSIKITVVGQASFVVPSAFTPNGDGRNDVFRPIAVGCKGINYFRVFNRWGQQVYYSTSLDVGWDGTFNNKQSDVGTYYWEISYSELNFSDKADKQSFLKGDVTLLR